jgi:hypothetical protein
MSSINLRLNPPTGIPPGSKELCHLSSNFCHRICVILSEVIASLREAIAQSKDPYKLHEKVISFYKAAKSHPGEA